MPRQRKFQQIDCQYFKWVIRPNRCGVLFADGRSNRINAGRHSLSTKTFDDQAREDIRQLDLVKAIEFGLADRALLDLPAADLLPLADGAKLYLDHVARPAAIGGASRGTYKRYRAVFDKLKAFAAEKNLRFWQEINTAAVEGYGRWLDERAYAHRTQLLELTTVKQASRWLISQKLIPDSCAISLRMAKPDGTPTYCYSQEEVTAIISTCFARQDLHWLGRAIVTLAYTGLRIGELAQLQWQDVDFGAGFIRVRDDSRGGSGMKSGITRTTKNHQSREVPIHPDVRTVLAPEQA